MALPSVRMDFRIELTNADRGVDRADRVVLDDPRRRDELTTDLDDRPRGCEAVTIWTVDRAFVRALAAREDRRRVWNVTIAGEHCYVQEDDVTFDGAISRATFQR